MDTHCTTKIMGVISNGEFAPLLLKSDVLLNRITEHEQISFHRTAGQVYSRCKQLLAGCVWNVDYSGQSFLASHGVDVAKLQKEIHDVKLDLTSIGEGEVVVTGPSGDLDSFIRREYEAAIFCTVESEKNNNHRNIRQLLYDNMRKEWHAHKDALLKCMESSGKETVLGKLSIFGQQTSEEPGDIVHSEGLAVSNQRISTGHYIDIPAVKKYEGLVCKLNESRLKGTSYLVCREMYESVGTDGNELGDVWEMLQYVVEDNPEFDLQDVANARKNNFFVVNQPYDSSASAMLRKSLVLRTKMFLEKTYVGFIDKMVRQFPKEAQLGGNPTCIEKIRAYINIRLGKDIPSEIEVVGSTPIWVYMFYLLRCGDLEGLLGFAERHSNAFGRMDVYFIEHVKCYVRNKENMLEEGLATLIKEEYARLRRNRMGCDPFKLAVYCVIGGCDPDWGDASGFVIGSIEDWMWLQLSLVREGFSSVSGRKKTYMLKDVQDKIMKLGNGYFGDPLSGFKVLLQCCLYEKAINYLFSIQKYRVEAMHILITLVYYGLLRMKNTSEMGYSYDVLEQNVCSHDVNFGLMVKRYVNVYLGGNLDASLNYVLLVSMVDQEESQIEAINLMRELVIQGREFLYVFGPLETYSLDEDVRDSEKGQLERYSRLISLSERNRLRTYSEKVVGRFSLRIVIANEVAHQFEAEGSLVDAISLYHCSKNYDQVVELLNKELGEKIKCSFLSPDNSFELVSQTKSIIEFYEYAVVRDKKKSVSAKFLSSFNSLKLLVEIFECFQSYYSKNWSSVIRSFRSLLPLSGECFNITQVNDFLRSLDAAVARYIPVILEVTVKSVQELFHELEKNNAVYPNESFGIKKTELKELSKTLVVLSGRLKLKPEVNALIATIDAKIY